MKLTLDFDDFFSGSPAPSFDVVARLVEGEEGARDRGFGGASSSRSMVSSSISAQIK